MSKINVYMLADITAGGQARQEGKIYALDAGAAAAVFSAHKGREPTPAEIARLGITPDAPAQAPARSAEEAEARKASRAAKRAAKQGAVVPASEAPARAARAR